MSPPEGRKDRCCLNFKHFSTSSQPGPWNNSIFLTACSASESRSPLKGGNKVSEKGATGVMALTAKYLNHKDPGYQQALHKPNGRGKLCFHPRERINKTDKVSYHQQESQYLGRFLALHSRANQSRLTLSC